MTTITMDFVRSDTCPADCPLSQSLQAQLGHLMCSHDSTPAGNLAPEQSFRPAPISATLAKDRVGDFRASVIEQCPDSHQHDFPRSKHYSLDPIHFLESARNVGSSTFQHTPSDNEPLWSSQFAASIAASLLVVYIIANYGRFVFSYLKASGMYLTGQRSRRSRPHGRQRTRRGMKGKSALAQQRSYSENQVSKRKFPDATTQQPQRDYDMFRSSDSNGRAQVERRPNSSNESSSSSKNGTALVSDCHGPPSSKQWPSPGALCDSGLKIKGGSDYDEGGNHGYNFDDRVGRHFLSRQVRPTVQHKGRQHRAVSPPVLNEMVAYAQDSPCHARTCEPRSGKIFTGGKFTFSTSDGQCWDYVLGPDHYSFVPEIIEARLWRAFRYERYTDGDFLGGYFRADMEDGDEVRFDIEPEDLDRAGDIVEDVYRYVEPDPEYPQPEPFALRRQYRSRQRPPPVQEHINVHMATRGPHTAGHAIAPQNDYDNGREVVHGRDCNCCMNANSAQPSPPRTSSLPQNYDLESTEDFPRLGSRRPSSIERERLRQELLEERDSRLRAQVRPVVPATSSIAGHQDPVWRREHDEPKERDGIRRYGVWRDQDRGVPRPELDQASHAEQGPGPRTVTARNRMPGYDGQIDPAHPAHTSSDWRRDRLQKSEAASSSQTFQTSGIRGGFLHPLQPSPLHNNAEDENDNDAEPVPTEDDLADEIERRLDGELDALFNQRRARVERRLAQRLMDRPVDLDVRYQDGQPVAVPAISNGLTAPAFVADASEQTESIFSPGWSFGGQQESETREAGSSSEEVSPRTARRGRSRSDLAVHNAESPNLRVQYQQATLPGPFAASAPRHDQPDNENGQPMGHQPSSNVLIPDWARPQVDQHDANTGVSNSAETARRPSSQPPPSRRNFHVNMESQPPAVSHRAPYIEDTNSSSEED